jgi:tRNA nucleotidyltransferase (CCA-adding enzyme)
MQLSEDPELNIQAEGPTLGAAFGQAALAMIAALTDPAAIRLEETIEIECAAPSAELLLADWLNAVVSEMAARGMVFGAFNVDTDGFQLHATASGEHVSQERHGPAIEIKGATLRDLAVSEDPLGEWRARCIVDFSRT